MGFTNLDRYFIPGGSEKIACGETPKDPVSKTSDKSGKSGKSHKSEKSDLSDKKFDGAIKLPINEIDSIIKSAEKFLARGDLWLLNGRSKNLLKRELQLAKDGKINELAHWLEYYEGRIIREKIKYQDEMNTKQEMEEFSINQILFGSSQNEIEGKIKQIEKRNEILRQRWNNLRKGERTQRRARINNELDANSRRMDVYQKALARLGSKN